MIFSTAFPGRDGTRHEKVIYMGDDDKPREMMLMLMLMLILLIDWNGWVCIGDLGDEDDGLLYYYAGRFGCLYKLRRIDG